MRLRPGNLGLTVKETETGLKSDLPIANPLSPPRPRWWSILKLLPWLIALGSFVLNLLTAWLNHFDGLYGQDAYAYFAHAVELYQHGSMFHHWQWEAEPRLLFWPLGYPALVALFFAFTGVSAQAAQLVSIVAQAVTAGLTAALVSRMYPYSNSKSFLSSETSQAQALILQKSASLFAGGAVALSPLGRQAGLTIMADALTLTLTTLALWLVVEGRIRQNGLWLAGAGLALAAAASTRYAALTVLPALLICWLWPTRRDEPNNSSMQRDGEGKSPAALTIGFLAHLSRPAALIAFGLGLGLAALPQTIINLAWPKPFWGHQWLTGWSPLNFGRTVFDTPDGHAVYPTSPLVFYGLEPLLNLRFLTPFIIPLVLAGLVVLWQGRRGWQSWTVLASWLVPVLLLGGVPYENERFSLSFLPPLAIIAGLGLGQIYRWVGHYFRFKSFLAASLIITLLGLAGLGWAGQKHLEGFAAFKQGQLGVVETVERKLPAEATLLSFGISLTYDHYYPLRPVFDLSALDEAAVAQIIAEKPVVYLLVEPAVLEQQFKATPIGNSYQAARKFALEPTVWQSGKYRLWQLRSGDRRSQL